MKKKAIIVSGYFNPIHKGHLEYFNNAKDLADELFVIVNSDLQRALKGSKEFQKEAEDKDRTVCDSIRAIFETYGQEYQLGFANGGDQDNNSIPEAPVCNELNIQLIDGLGDKIQSSSWLLNKD